MLILMILLAVCLLGSFFFSGSETGFVSWNPLKVAHAAGQGGRVARMGMRLINNRDAILATVLIGNNVVNVSMTLIFDRLFERLDSAVALDLSRIPSPESWFLTPVVLLFCEIIPKSLYRTYPFKLTMKSVPVLTVMFYVMSPFFFVFGRLRRLIGGGAADGGAESGASVREDILLVVTEGARRGHIFESADRIMKNTLDMKGTLAESFAVPLDEWKKSRPSYRSSQMLSEFGIFSSAGGDEIVVFDDAMKAPVGFVSLLDAAAHRSRPLMTMGSLLRPLPRVKGGSEALSWLRTMPPDSPRYYAIVNDDGVFAILDKMDIFGAAFAGGK